MKSPSYIAWYSLRMLSTSLTGYSTFLKMKATFLSLYVPFIVRRNVSSTCSFFGTSTNTDTTKLKEKEFPSKKILLMLTIASLQPRNFANFLRNNSICSPTKYFASFLILKNTSNSEYLSITTPINDLQTIHKVTL